MQELNSPPALYFFRVDSVGAWWPWIMVMARASSASEQKGGQPRAESNAAMDKDRKGVLKRVEKLRG